MRIHNPAEKPRLTQANQLQELVMELQRNGLDGVQLYKTLTDIGIIDLDVLGGVMTSRQSQDEAHPMARSHRSTSQPPVSRSASRSVRDAAQKAPRPRHYIAA